VKSPDLVKRFPKQQQEINMLRLVATVLFLVFAGSAFAQESPSEFKFTISSSNASVLLQALGNMPYAQSAALIADLQMQARQQITEFNAKKAPVPTPKPEKK